MEPRSTPSRFENVDRWQEFGPLVALAMTVAHWIKKHRADRLANHKISESDGSSVRGLAPGSADTFLHRRRRGTKTVIRTRTTVGTMVIATCAFTGLVLAALPAEAQISEPVNIGSVRASQANSSSFGPALDTEDLSNQTVKVAVSKTALSLRSDGSRVTLEFSGTTRRQVVERLLATSGIAVDWLDPAYAAELIKGRYVGSLEEIVDWLLSSTSYVAAYDMSGSAPRMTGVVIHGGSSPSSNERTLQSAPASYMSQKWKRDIAEQNARAGERQRQLQARARERRRQLQARAELLQKVQAARALRSVVIASAGLIMSARENNKRLLHQSAAAAAHQHVIVLSRNTRMRPLRGGMGRGSR